MADSSSYTPPKVWKWDSESGGRFASINRPIAGATHEKELPVGEHPLQLYSLATPNGVKVTVLLEELLALGKQDAEYDAYLINIGDGDQFGSGFVAANPNSKIPTLVDHSTSPPTRVFESGAILVYLAEKFEYPINRYAMEVKRQLDVLDRNLAERRYLGGDEYTIADMATYPWYGSVVLSNIYDAEVFLDAKSYTNVVRWASEIQKRPAVQRGQRVNKPWGPGEERVPERHAASDLD